MKPYLSIIAASRNDNHGGDLTNRMFLFLRGLYHQLNKYRIPAEIILIEWNPPASKPSLAEILPRPDSEYAELRIITVPNSIHKTYKISDRLPLFQMIAKNVGIRRAKAPFILCTNVDLLFSDKLSNFLSKRTLEKGTYYRCNRCDIPKNIDYSRDISELIKFAKGHIVQRLGKNRFYANFMGQSKIWYSSYFAQIIVVALAAVKKILNSRETTLIESADTWASGDFTLMHRDDWLKIKGYFELDAYSIHIDSLAIFAALGQGIKQKILPQNHCTYHVSHDSGWELQDPMKKLFFDINMPMLDWNSAQSASEYMLRNKEILPINGDNWGLIDHNLEEKSFDLGKK